MSEDAYMKMAKADRQEWKALFDWFTERENNQESNPEWRRVVFGYQVLVDNTCDPDKDYLDWKPEIKSAIEAYEPKESK